MKTKNGEVIEISWDGGIGPLAHIVRGHFPDEEALKILNEHYKDSSYYECEWNDIPYQQDFKMEDFKSFERVYARWEFPPWWAETKDVRWFRAYRHQSRGVFAVTLGVLDDCVIDEIKPPSQPE